MTADTITFPELLARLGYTDDDPRGCAERISICHQGIGGVFSSEVRVWSAAAGVAARLIDNSRWNLWFGVNALGEVAQGRGRESDVVRLCALIADLDLKEGGCGNLEIAYAIITAVSEVLGEDLVAVTHSGHGLQPYWAVEVASALALCTVEAKRLLERFKRLVKDIAARHGAGVDSVFDLSRVFRVPGSVNYKDPDNPVPVRCFASAGKPLTVERITAALDAAGIPEDPEKRRGKKQPRGKKMPKNDKPPLYAVSAAMTPGKPSLKVRRRVAEALTDVAIETDRHHETRNHTLALLRYGYNGEPGVGAVLEGLYRAFVFTVGPDRDGGEEEAAGEFANFVAGAEKLLAAEPPRGDTGDTGTQWPSPQAPRQVAVRVAEHYTAAGRPLAFWAQQWFRWDGTAYRKLEDTELRGDLYQLLEDAHYYNARGEQVPWNPDQRKLGNALDAMKAPPVLLGPGVRPQTWLRGDDEPVIACANGLLRLADRTLLEPSPAFFNTFALPFDFDADARPPSRWLQFLDEILPGDAEAVAALQEWFGYVLSGRTDLQKALMLLGRTRSGKGTVDKVLAALVGSANHTGLAGSDLAADFGLEQLVTKTVATFSDDRMSMNGKRFVERLLRISGEDVVTVTQKYRSAWTGQLGVRLQFMSNEPPALPDASGAIVGRLVVIYLPTCWLGREDISLVGRLYAELPGILHWSLDGLERLTATGRFTLVSSSAGLIEELHESASPIHTFVSEQCVTGATRSVGKDQLYLAWRKWCAANGHEPGAKTGLTKKLVASLGRDVIDPEARERRAKQKQVRIYRGIDLLPSARRELGG